MKKGVMKIEDMKIENMMTENITKRGEAEVGAEAVIDTEAHLVIMMITMMVMINITKGGDEIISQGCTIRGAELTTNLHFACYEHYLSLAPLCKHLIEI